MEEKNPTKSLFDLCVGEFIEVLAKFTVPTADGVPYPLSMQGYLIDRDDEFLYLGESPIEPDKFIKISDIIYIQKINPKENFAGLLEDMEFPGSEEEIN